MIENAYTRVYFNFRSPTDIHVIYIATNFNSEIMKLNLLVKNKCMRKYFEHCYISVTIVSVFHFKPMPCLTQNVLQRTG